MLFRSSEVITKTIAGTTSPHISISRIKRRVITKTGTRSTLIKESVLGTLSAVFFILISVLPCGNNFGQLPELIIICKIYVRSEPHASVFYGFADKVVIKSLVYSDLYELTARTLRF